MYTLCYEVRTLRSTVWTLCNTPRVLHNIVGTLRNTPGSLRNTPRTLRNTFHVDPQWSEIWNLKSQQEDHETCMMSEIWNLKSQREDPETCTNLKKAPPYGRGLIIPNRNETWLLKLGSSQNVKGGLCSYYIVVTKKRKLTAQEGQIKFFL